MADAMIPSVGEGRALIEQMRERIALTYPQAPGGQHVGPRMYQQPTTHRFARDEMLPLVNALEALLTVAQQGK